MNTRNNTDLIKKLSIIANKGDNNIRSLSISVEEAREILEALWRPESKIPAGPKQEPTTEKNYLDATKKKETPYSYHLPLSREEFLAIEAAIENELAHSLSYRKLLVEYRGLLSQVVIKMLLNTTFIVEE